MDDAEIEAVLKWLGSSSSSREVEREQMRDRPLAFLESHLDLLPSHLQALFTKALSVRQRGQVARIRERRRHFAEAKQPEQLSIVEARTRDPLAFKQYMGRAELGSSGTRSQPPASHLQQASTSSPSAPLEGQREKVTDPENVMNQPRFQKLVKRYDEEELLGTLRQQEEREAETIEEVESDEEEEEGEVSEEERPSNEAKEEDTIAEELNNEKDFQTYILQRFIQGDVSRQSRKG